MKNKESDEIYHMKDNLTIINNFYESFFNGNWVEMGNFYSKKAVFSDPIFVKLNYKEVTNMWKMLLNNNQNFKIKYKIERVSESQFIINWKAEYLFGKKKRRVINFVESNIKIKDSKIIEQIDSFNFYKWAKQSLGIVGLFLGKSKLFRKKISNSAYKKLKDSFN